MWLIALAVAFWMLAGYAFVIHERKTALPVALFVWLRISERI